MFCNLPRRVHKTRFISNVYILSASCSALCCSAAVTSPHARRRNRTSPLSDFDLAPCASCVRRPPPSFFPVVGREAKISYFLRSPPRPCARTHLYEGNCCTWLFHRSRRWQRPGKKSAKDGRHRRERRPHRRRRFATLRQMLQFYRGITSCTTCRHGQGLVYWVHQRG